MLAIEPLHPRYGARLHGVDMRAPISDETFARIKAALATYAVCVIGHHAPPANEAHIAFSARLGPLQRSAQKIAGTGERVQYPDIVDQSNLDEVGEIYADDDRRLAYKRANRLWHTDMSFYDVRATYSLLAAHAIPPQGAETEFTDMRAVWDALPESLRRAMRSPMSTRPSGRTALYLASHVCGIVGSPQERARRLLDDLMSFATQPRTSVTGLKSMEVGASGSPTVFGDGKS